LAQGQEVVVYNWDRTLLIVLVLFQ